MAEIAAYMTGLYRDGFAMRQRVISAPMFGSQALPLGLSFGIVRSVFSFVSDISLEGSTPESPYERHEDACGGGSSMAEACAADLTRRLPTPEEIDNAAEAVTALVHARECDGRLVILGADGRELRIAPAIGDLLVDLLGHVARGDMVTLVPLGGMLTTKQAADLLNVSRPFLSGLLKKGEIPFIPVGSHRRVMHADLMAYKAHRDAARNAALDELARLGQEFDAG